MFRATPMKRVLLLVPRGDLEPALEAVARLGVLHLLDLPGREEWRSAVRPYEVGERRSRGEEGLRQVETLFDFFRPPPARESAPLPRVDDVVRELRGWLTELEFLRGERARLHARIEERERALASAGALAAAGVAPGALAGLEVLHASCGWLRQEELPRLEESLARTPHRIVTAGSRVGERLVVAFVRPRDRAALEGTLESVGFAPVCRSGGEPAGSVASLEQDLEEARRALGALEGRFEQARGRLAAPLAGARAALGRELQLVDACALAGRSDSAVFLTGWLPAARAGALRAALREATGGRFHLRLDDPGSLASVRTGSETVPVELRNPALLRPFEGLTAEYGLPRWREIDPTPLVALGFCAMFGLMFGDLGQGAVLAAFGAWLARRRARDAGLVVLQCGIASMAFGLAYGSVFGVEGWLPALWLRPLEDLPRLLRAGAAIGLGTVGLSFGLGVLNAALRRDWSNALFGTHGLLAAFAYWAAAALALRWLVTGEAGEAAARSWPLVVLPLAVLLGARATAGWRSTNPSARSLATAALEAVIELVDVVVRGIANTVSFVRLSAFAVSHAALLFAVFALMELLPSSGAGNAGRVLVFVLGNAVVIALEGLIVSIQGVRLVYYEFFSRFHEGTGVRYQPLQLCASSGEEGAR